MPIDGRRRRGAGPPERERCPGQTRHRERVQTYGMTDEVTATPIAAPRVRVDQTGAALQPRRSASTITPQPRAWLRPGRRCRRPGPCATGGRGRCRRRGAPCSRDEDDPNRLPSRRKPRAGRRPPRRRSEDDGRCGDVRAPPAASAMTGRNSIAAPWRAEPVDRREKHAHDGQHGPREQQRRVAAVEPRQQRHGRRESA